MNKDTSADESIAKIKQSWLDYEGEVVSARKPYQNAIKKQMSKKEDLGPASKALLERINHSFGTISLNDCITWCRKKTKISHTEYWWYRRLTALALEGYIEARVYRSGDKVITLFRKKRETGS